MSSAAAGRTRPLRHFGHIGGALGDGRNGLTHFWHGVHHHHGDTFRTGFFSLSGLLATTTLALPFPGVLMLRLPSLP